jgi:hypothetical protein
MRLGVRCCLQSRFARLLTILAVEWGAIDAANRGSLSPFFLAAIFAPVILLLALMIYYTLKMRAV